MRTTGFLLISTLLLSSCILPFTRSPEKLNKEGQDYYQSEDYSIALPGSQTRELELHYLGCGGFLARKGGMAFFNDPFFSNTSFFKVTVKSLFGGSIKPKPRYVDLGLKNVGSLEDVEGVLISHGHYDHLLDLPYLFKTGSIDAAATKVYGNATTGQLMSHFDPAGPFVNMEDIMATHLQPGQWLTIASGQEDSILVMSIRSNHAPHTDHIKFYSGEYQGDLRIKDREKMKSRVKDWREGQSLSYLVDFYNQGEIDFRMFIQASASDSLLGFPPQHILDKHPVDLAVMCVASYELTNGYPCALLGHIKPSYVVWVHWEDFFLRYNRKNPKMVRRTRVKRFPGHVTGECGYAGAFSFPKPGTKITVKY